MKKILSTILLCLMLTSCGDNAKTTFIKGYLNPTQRLDVYIDGNQVGTYIMDSNKWNNGYRIHYQYTPSQMLVQGGYPDMKWEDFYYGNMGYVLRDLKQ